MFPQENITRRSAQVLRGSTTKRQACETLGEDKIIWVHILYKWNIEIETINLFMRFEGIKLQHIKFTHFWKSYRFLSYNIIFTQASIIIIYTL
jgi:hypothetical protein